MGDDSLPIIYVLHHPLSPGPAVVGHGGQDATTERLLMLKRASPKVQDGLWKRCRRRAASLMVRLVLGCYASNTPTANAAAD